MQNSSRLWSRNASFTMRRELTPARRGIAPRFYLRLLIRTPWQRSLQGEAGANVMRHSPRRAQPLPQMRRQTDINPQRRGAVPCRRRHQGRQPWRSTRREQHRLLRLQMPQPQHLRQRSMRLLQLLRAEQPRRRQKRQRQMERLLAQLRMWPRHRWLD